MGRIEDSAGTTAGSAATLQRLPAWAGIASRPVDRTIEPADPGGSAGRRGPDRGVGVDVEGEAELIGVEGERPVESLVGTGTSSSFMSHGCAPSRRRFTGMLIVWSGLARSGSVAVTLAFGGIEFLGGEAQRGPGHRGGMCIEESPETVAVPLASLADPASDRCLDEVLGIVNQQFGDCESVIELPHPDEGPGRGDRGSALVPVG